MEIRVEIWLTELVINIKTDVSFGLLNQPAIWVEYINVNMGLKVHK